ncbi:MAG: 30S ribosomal protein THX [bacterium]
MGKGDRRTRKGKIFRGSHGKTRPRKRRKSGKEASQSA